RLTESVLFYAEKLGVRPEVFGRSYKGFTPVLPQLLKLAGFQGVIHFTPLDGWQLSKETQSKMFWKGTGGVKFPALMKFPLRSDDHATFFTLPKKMGYSMSGDQTPTFVLAHYPLQKVVWFSDLMRASKYGNILGRVPKIDEYFERTKYTGSEKSFGFNDYWVNYLLKSVQEDRTGPVSDWVEFYRLYAEISAMQNIRGLFASIKKSYIHDETMRGVLEKKIAPLFENVEKRIFGNADDIKNVPSINEVSEISEMISSQLTYSICGKPIEELEKLSDSELDKICGMLFINPLSFSRTVHVDVTELGELPAVGGKVLLAKRSLKKGSKDLKKRLEAVIELPPLGYTWVGHTQSNQNISTSSEAAENENRENNEAGTSENVSRANTADKTVYDESDSVNGLNTQTSKNSQTSKTERRGWSALVSSVTNIFSKGNSKKTAEPNLVERVREKVEQRGRGVFEQENYLLRNDYFEARVDTITGEIKSLTTSNTRGNRFAYNLAFRSPEDERKDDPRSEYGPLFGYTIMAADKFEIESPGPITGVLRVTGRLMRHDGEVAAKFTQRIIIRRLSRVLEFEVELEPVLEPGSKPWDSYYAARFAWSDQLADVFGGVHGGSFELETQLLQCPEFVDIRSEKRSITILCNGMPYHRLFDEYRMDTILIPHNEKCRKFRFGVGVDLPNPGNTAQEFLLGGFQPNGVIPSPAIPSAWLFTTGAKNVVIVRLEPLFEKLDENDLPTGETSADLSGLRIIFQETENSPCTFTFRTFLPIRKAFKTDLLRKRTEELAPETEDIGHITLDIRGRELLPIEIYL
ncbi:MAG: hypothetical protein ACRC2T_06390, partial [Thermoguttaceae bacterium]